MAEGNITTIDRSQVNNFNKMCSNVWKVTVDDEFKKNPTLTQKHIDCIMDWMLDQSHLPKISGKIMLILIVLNFMHLHSVIFL